MIKELINMVSESRVATIGKSDELYDVNLTLKVKDGYLEIDYRFCAFPHNGKLNSSIKVNVYAMQTILAQKYPFFSQSVYAEQESEIEGALKLYELIEAKIEAHRYTEKREAFKAVGY